MSTERQMSRILEKFEASCSIFNPASESVEDLKKKFIEASLKEEARKEQNPWARMHQRITKAQELLVILRRDHPDTIHDCLFGCNEIKFCFDDMNVGDLCFIVHKSLNELVERINYREDNGEFKYIPTHYPPTHNDTGKVAKDEDAETDGGAGAANDISDHYTISYKNGAIVMDME